jgi:hypothetical protein
MNEKTEVKKTKKGLFTKMFEKLDKKMDEKAKSSPCCCQPNKSNKDSCCS